MAQGLDQVVGTTLVSVRNGPGPRLRAAREAKGATQLEIAQELRLHQDIIKRIEEDDYDSNLPLVFIKGYLRAFAGLVGVDQDQVIIEFMHLGLVDPVKQLHERINPIPRKLTQFQHEKTQYRSWIVFGSIAAAILAICFFMWHQFDDTPASRESSTVSAPITIEPQINEPQSNAAPSNQAAPVEQSPSQSAAPASIDPAPSVQAAAQVESPPAKPVIVQRRAQRHDADQNYRDTHDDGMLF